jgi:DNA modification methylase
VIPRRIAMPVAGAQVVMGDCLQILRGLPANRFDALVTDPPAGIGFMGKEWDKFGRSRMRDGEAAKAAASGRGGKTVQPFGYSSAPSLSQDQKQLAKVRGLFLDFLTPRLAECLRVCKPGAVGLVWALPRTSHWTALAIEEGGWVIQDRIAHLFGTGFPKGKHLLKPACEDWWLCRKPGPLWLGVEECRVPGVGVSTVQGGKEGGGYDVGSSNGSRHKQYQTPDAGRWPAHLVLDEEAARLLDEQVIRNGARCAAGSSDGTVHGKFQGWKNIPTGTVKTIGYGHGSPGASRFFYCAKASKRDRGEGNSHPTVKSTALMAWLVKLACPEGGVILDPFCGTASTGVACLRTNRRFYGVESDPESVVTSRRRLVAESAALRS